MDSNSIEYVEHIKSLTNQSFDMFRMPSGHTALAFHTVRVGYSPKGHTVRKLTSDKRATVLGRDFRFSGAEAEVECIVRALGDRIVAISGSGDDTNGSYYTVALSNS